MSLLTRLYIRRAPTLNASRALVFTSCRSSLHTTSVQAALSESDRDREDVDKEIDHHKNDQLQKQKEGKGHWKGELSSNSEANVKADRAETDSSPDGIKKLQEETTKFAKSQHKGEA